MKTGLKYLVAAGWVAIGLVALPAQAGDITREHAAADFKWTSTECRAPNRPFVAKNSPQAQALMQGYAREVAYYLDCLKMEAQRDFDRAQMEMQEAVQRKLQAETDRMNDEVERMARQGS